MMNRGVVKSGSPISRWITRRPCSSSARARASTSKAVSVPSRASPAASACSATALLLGAAPQLPSDRVLELLADVGDEPDRACDHGDAAGHAPGEAELAADRPDRAGRVHGQDPARRSLGLGTDQLHQVDVVAGPAVLPGELEQPHGARIDRLVDWMTEPRDDLAGPGDDGEAGDLLERRPPGSRLECLGEHLCGSLDRAGEGGP